MSLITPVSKDNPSLQLKMYGVTYLHKQFNCADTLPFAPMFNFFTLHFPLSSCLNTRESSPTGSSHHYPWLLKLHFAYKLCRLLLTFCSTFGTISSNNRKWVLTFYMSMPLRYTICNYTISSSDDNVTDVLKHAGRFKIVLLNVIPLYSD